MQTNTTKTLTRISSEVARQNRYIQRIYAHIYCSKTVPSVVAIDTAVHEKCDIQHPTTTAAYLNESV